MTNSNPINSSRDCLLSSHLLHEQVASLPCRKEIETWKDAVALSSWGAFINGLHWSFFAPVRACIKTVSLSSLVVPGLENRLSTHKSSSITITLVFKMFFIEDVDMWTGRFCLIRYILKSKRWFLDGVLFLSSHYLVYAFALIIRLSVRKSLSVWLYSEYSQCSMYIGRSNMLTIF
jgi:hypothetical protein